MWKSFKKLIGIVADVTAASSDVVVEHTVKGAHTAKEKSVKGLEVAKEVSVLAKEKVVAEATVLKSQFIRVGGKLVDVGHEASIKMDARINELAEKASAWRAERASRPTVHVVRPSRTDVDLDMDTLEYVKIPCRMCGKIFETYLMNDDMPCTDVCSQECFEAKLQDEAESVCCVRCHCHFYSERDENGYYPKYCSERCKQNDEQDFHDQH